MKSLLFPAFTLLAGAVTGVPARPGPHLPPPAVSGERIIAPAAPRPGLHAGEPYSIGELTDEEQLYLEWINRARANPAAEGRLLAALTDPGVTSAYDFFGVDLGLMQAEAAQYAPAPPLACNARLLEAARGHSEDMFANMFQGHGGSNGSDAGGRITAAGYMWASFGENVFAYAESVLHGHAGFFVDWGNGPGGMQQPRGHRETIMNAGYREIGVGVVLGTNGDVGPQLVTQDFASAPGAKPFITGVVYYDLNTNGVYEAGEGLGGVAITAAGVAGSAVSAGSGGYALPVAGNGAYEVTVAVPGLASQAQPAMVAGNANVKLDFRPGYVAPVLSGAGVAYAGRSNLYAISPVGGATGYEWRQARREPWTGALGAENGLVDFTLSVTPGYAVDQDAVKAAGTRAYRMAHPEPGDPQRMTLLAPLRLGAAPRLLFSSRLGWASADQHARVELSRDDGATWEAAWSQAGTDGAGETGFREVEVELAAYASASVRVRFSYVAGGPYFTDTVAGVGWYLDEIRFEDAEQLTGAQVAAAAGPEVRFQPATPGRYLLSARARTGPRLWPWGPAREVEAREGAASPPEFTSVRVEDAGRIVLTVAPRAAGAPGLRLEAAPAPDGPWAPAGISVPEAGGEVSLPGPTQPAQFFRLLEGVP